jgi:hypothetical protein
VGFAETNAWETDPGAVAASAPLSANSFATVAGVYNGLFYQTNADGSPNVTEDSAGFLGNCVVASNGIFSAKVYFGGASYPLAGTFDGFGNAGGTIPLDDTGLSNLTFFLHLDLSNGTEQITGAISGATADSDWTAPLLGDLATNGLPQLPGFVFLMPPGCADGSPSGYGMALGFATESVLTINGILGDDEALAQTVPISKDGNVPVYMNLYASGGLLEGWVNVTNGVLTGTLTWIRPSGILQPAGFPQGFTTTTAVYGATFQ